MVFGQTYTDQYHEDWRPWFAWYPVTLIDGRTAWWETVLTRWYGFLDSGRWQYTTTSHPI